jgi:uncharacterized protein (TIGR02265 family)
MKKAKGTILVDFIKTMKADKSGMFTKYLTDEDRKILGQRIMPSAWYPYETFKHCFQAAYEILAKSNPETVKQWGRLYGSAIMGGIYKNLLKAGEPMEYIKKYEVYVKNFLDFGKIEIKEEGNKQVVLKLFDFDPDFTPLYYIMYGWLECTLEMVGAKDLKIEILPKSPSDKHDAAIRMTWT